MECKACGRKVGSDGRVQTIYHCWKCRDEMCGSCQMIHLSRPCGDPIDDSIRMIGVGFLPKRFQTKKPPVPTRPASTVRAVSTSVTLSDLSRLNASTGLLSGGDNRNILGTKFREVYLQFNANSIQVLMCVLADAVTFLDKDRLAGLPNALRRLWVTYELGAAPEYVRAFANRRSWMNDTLMKGKLDSNIQALAYFLSTEPNLIFDSVARLRESETSAKQAPGFYAVEAIRSSAFIAAVQFISDKFTRDLSWREQADVQIGGDGIRDVQNVELLRDMCADSDEKRMYITTTLLRKLPETLVLLFTNVGLSIPALSKYGPSIFDLLATDNVAYSAVMAGFPTYIERLNLDMLMRIPAYTRMITSKLAPLLQGSHLFRMFQTVATASASKPRPFNEQMEREVVDEVAKVELVNPDEDSSYERIVLTTDGVGRDRIFAGSVERLREGRFNIYLAPSYTIEGRDVYPSSLLTFADASVNVTWPPLRGSVLAKSATPKILAEILVMVPPDEEAPRIKGHVENWSVTAALKNGTQKPDGNCPLMAIDVLLRADVVIGDLGKSVRIATRGRIPVTNAAFSEDLDTEVRLKITDVTPTDSLNSGQVRGKAQIDPRRYGNSYFSMVLSKVREHATLKNEWPRPRVIGSMADVRTLTVNDPSDTGGKYPFAFTLARLALRLDPRDVKMVEAAIS